MIRRKIIISSLTTRYTMTLDSISIVSRSMESKSKELSMETKRK